MVIRVSRASCERVNYGDYTLHFGHLSTCILLGWLRGAGYKHVLNMCRMLCLDTRIQRIDSFVYNSYYA